MRANQIQNWQKAIQDLFCRMSGIISKSVKLTQTDIYVSQFKGQEFGCSWEENIFKICQENVWIPK